MPVGLFGLARNIILVRAVTFASNPSTLAVKSVLRRDYGNAARRADDDRVFEKTILGIQTFVAGAEVHVREQRDQFVRTIAADDVFGVETVMSCDGRPQGVRGAVGI